MLNKIAVFDYWLACVREQDIQRTSLSNDINSHQLISLDDENILLSNQRDSVKITLSNILRDILRKERTRQIYRNNKDSRPVFFFPLVIINGQSLPLFYVDLADLEDRIVSGNGELSFEINPWSVDTKIGVVSDTFVKLGYDEENIDLNDSVIGFIEKVTGQFTLNFQLALKELLSFIKEESKSVSNPISKVSEIRNIGIIKYSDFSEATLIFKKDLLFIKDHSALLNSTIISDYVGKKSSKIDFIEQPFLGGFFNYPMSRGQSIAISEVMCGEREIVSVQGGPGTGKTTLILSVISSIITERALSIAHDKVNDDAFTLVTSFTNKAVDNVVNIMDAEYGEKFSNWIFIQLGNKERRLLAHDRILALINQIEIDKFDRILYEKLKGFLLNAKAILTESAKESIVSESVYSDDDFTILKSYGYKGELKNEPVLNFILTLMNMLESTPITAINSLISSIKTDADSLEKMNVNRVIVERQIAFFNDLMSTYPAARKMVMSGELGSKSQANNPKFKTSVISIFLNKLATFFGFDSDHKPFLGENGGMSKDKQIEEAYKKLRDRGGDNYIHCQSLYRQILSDSEKLDTRLKKKIAIKNILIKASKPTDVKSSMEKSRVEHVSENKKLFEASLHFLYQHILKNKVDVIDALMAWSSVVTGKSTDNHDYHNNFSQFVKNASLPFPVIGCTLSSLGSIFEQTEATFINNKPFKLTVCDEAGMVPIFCMPSILMRSKKVLVIGDQKQLPPIINIDRNRLLEFKNKYGLVDESNIYNPMLSSAFQRSSFASEASFNDIGQSVILDEHRRCQQKISDCFMDIGGYHALTNNTPSLDASQLALYRSISEREISFIDVKGMNDGKRNANTKEVQRIGELLTSLQSKGVDIKTQVGIITPFQNQSILLQSEYRRLVNHSVNHKKIGTVHAFQGAEYDIVILSLVAFNDSFHVQFISKAPNLLNVAISRARHRLIVVGDRDFIENQGGNLEKLVKHATL